MSNYDTRPLIYRGRGSLSNDVGRYESLTRVAIDDGWDNQDQELPPLHTEILVDNTKTIINYNQSPDIPFDRSINPYRGCEHGCTYCFARPSHTYLGFSAGLDFESRILIKPEAANLLRKELAKPGYQCASMALGTNTDPYQPLEREHLITRKILEVLAEFRHPFSIVTKNSLVERDIKLLAEMARQNLAEVFISITTLNKDIARTLEPRAAAPHRRLQTLETLSEAGIPVGVMVAPLIPALTDTEMERILEAATEHGAKRAGYILLRLPLEVSALFENWLKQYYPLKVDHVMSLIRQSRDGKTNHAEFHQRMRGSGLFADMISQRFKLATKRLGLNQGHQSLDTSLFRPPGASAPQMELFD